MHEKIAIQKYSRGICSSNMVIFLDTKKFNLFAWATFSMHNSIVVHEKIAIQKYSMEICSSNMVMCFHLKHIMLSCNSDLVKSFDECNWNFLCNGTSFRINDRMSTIMKLNLLRINIFLILRHLACNARVHEPC